MPTALSQPPAPTNRSAPRAAVLRFDSAEAFRAEFRESISAGAIFVPTSGSFSARQQIGVTFDLAFCGETIDVPAEVVAVVDAALAEACGAEAGISVRFTQTQAELRGTLVPLTGVLLESQEEANRSRRRGPPRTDTSADIVVRTPEREYVGQTANLSYSGVLALLPMAAIPVGSLVQVHLSNLAVELDLIVDGRVVHSRRCDGGSIAHGIQLQYPVDRIEEVMAFVEFLQSFDRARRLATVAGDIDAAGLSTVLDMFVHTALSGTVAVSRGEEFGKIVFSENFVLHCAVGMVKGMKALARMAAWTEGRFEFRHDLELPEATEDPQPFEAAMMMASVQLDEMARIGADAFGPNDTFRVRDDRMAIHGAVLTELEREVFGFAADGFNVAAIADMVPAPDADILKALVVLVDVGVVDRRR